MATLRYYILIYLIEPDILNCGEEKYGYLRPKATQDTL
jgi:hypothetical protein